MPGLASIVIPASTIGGAAFGTGAGVKAGVKALQPDIPEPPSLPTQQDPNVARAQEAEADRLRRRRGRASTILTSGQGVVNPLGFTSGADASRQGAALLGG